MKRHNILLLAATLTIVSPASAIVPANGGAATGVATTVNNGPGNQSDAHVSGDIVSYTDGTAQTSVRYYRFSTAVDAAIATPLGGSDSLSDVSGSRIAFTRVTGATANIEVFDVATSNLREVDPQPAARRFGSVIGGDTVAYVDFGTGSGVIFTYDLSTGGPSTQISAGPETAQNPGVSPSGNAVVWEQCAASVLVCDVMKSVRVAGVWTAPTLVANSSANADTDGTWIVYDSDRVGSATGRDIYFQAVAGGPEWQIALPGEQDNPSISNGVISFESSVGAPADIFVYVIATNTLYQITNTPTVHEQLNDIAVLANGDIRVVWSASDGLLNDDNVYALTFTPSSTPQQQLANLANTIAGFGLPHGTENSLLAKIDAATDSLARGDTNAACNQLNALINEARANKKLTEEQAKAIIDLAQAMLTTLGCS